MKMRVLWMVQRHNLCWCNEVETNSERLNGYYWLCITCSRGSGSNEASVSNFVFIHSPRLLEIALSWAGWLFRALAEGAVVVVEGRWGGMSMQACFLV